MHARRIDDEFTVAGQISADDVAAIANAGFKSVICNRPDGESFGQPPHDGVRAAVEAAGMEFRYIPVVSGAITGDDVVAMSAALDDLPRPVFAYCRSGGRCTNLYALVQQMKG